MLKPNFRISFTISSLMHIAIVAVATAFISTSDLPKKNKEVIKEVIRVKLMANEQPLLEELSKKKIIFDKKLVNEEKPENTDAISWKNSKAKGKNEGKKEPYSDNVNSNSFGKERDTGKSAAEDLSITKLNKSKKMVTASTRESIVKIAEKGLEKSKNIEAGESKPSLVLRTNTGSAESADDDDPISLETKEVKYMSYFVEIRKKINSIWQYPVEAITRGETGNAVVNFYIKEDGTLESSAIYVTSGNQRLDHESLRAVNTSAPFPPIPDDVGKTRLNLVATFKYSLDIGAQ